MTTEAAAGEPFEAQVRDVLARIAGDLSTLIDHTFKVQSSAAQRCRSKPAASKRVHIAFKLAFELRGELHHGALLLPLPEAISLASFLLLDSKEGVLAKRALTDLEQPTKDAMLEIANFIGGATDGALRRHFPQGLSVRSLGCQGLRADQLPAFPYKPGDELILGRAQAQIADFPSFEMLLVLPMLVSANVPAS